MKTTYSGTQKQAILDRYFSGESVKTLVSDTEIPRSTIYAWVKKANNIEKSDPVSRKTYNQLMAHTRRLEEMLSILKTCGCAPHNPPPEKLKVLEKLYMAGSHSVRVICEALDVPGGTFYNHIFRNKMEENSYEKRREELRGHIRKRNCGRRVAGA